MTSAHGTHLVFEDNQRVALLYGPHNSHLAYLEERLAVVLRPRGNKLHISGERADVQRTVEVFTDLWTRLARRDEMDVALLDSALMGRQVGQGDQDHLASSKGKASFSRTDFAPSVLGAATEIQVGSRTVVARTSAQQGYIAALQHARMVFCLGPAGTGKTFLAVAYGMALLETGAVDSILLTRPAVEAGERLGFLPGDLRDKIDPYLQPLYDALRMLARPQKIEKLIESRTIDIAPLAFMRGRSLARSFIVLDEAQNATATQMKMFLTRLGPEGRMVIVGDPSQVDVQVPSGLTDAKQVLDGVAGIHFHAFTSADVVRDDLVAKVVAAYERDTKNPARPQSQSKSRSKPRSKGHPKT